MSLKKKFLWVSTLFVKIESVIPQILKLVILQFLFMEGDFTAYYIIFYLYTVSNTIFSCVMLQIL